MRFTDNTERENFLYAKVVQAYVKKQVTDGLSDIIEELTDDLITHLKPQINALIYRDAGTMLDTAAVRFDFYTNGEKQQ